MSALAYLLLPVTGIFAFLRGASPRVRAHGLQAVIYGALWPAALYLASEISATATLVVALAGGAVWLGLLGTAALGRDLWLPGLGRFLERATAR